MPCFHPMKGYRSLTVNPSGKRSIVFNYRQGFKDLAVDLPCGQCIGCRLERSRQWAIRCVHESSLYQDNSFITLTYSPDHLPTDGSVSVRDFQMFMKRLRRSIGDRRVRFFACGEYGDNFSRPHYHACLFNFDFSDKVFFKEVNGCRLYVSKALEKLWPFGFCTVGDVTFESAAYVARYVTKKITGKNALHHYNEVDLETGEVLSERRPEFVLMSRRPGIGRDWLEKFSSDVFPRDYVVLRGKKLRPPRYYSSEFEKRCPLDFAKMRYRRLSAAEEHADNNTRDRLDVREFIQLYKADQLKRGFEYGT